MAHLISRVALACVLLLSAPAAVRGDDTIAKLPGDPEYYVKLKNIVPSDGDFDPPFDMEQNDFTLKIRNPKMTSVTLTLSLDWHQYAQHQTPVITLDDEPIEYTSLAPVTKEIRLDGDIAALDKVFVLKVADPKSPFGVFPFQTYREWKYNLRIMQPADYTRVTEIKGITVTTGSGETVYPEDTHDEAWEYKIPEMESEVSIQAFCQDESTALEFDGKVIDNGETQVVPLKSTDTQVDISCKYEETAFGHSWKERMYAIKLYQPKDLNWDNLDLTLRISEEYGFCDRPTEKITYWDCYSLSAEPKVLVTCPESHAEVSLEDSDNHKHGLNLIPRQIEIGDDVSRWELVVEGGKEPIRSPVRMTKAASCDEYTCAQGTVKKTNYDRELAQARLCRGTSCSWKDQDTCCNGTAVMALKQELFDLMDANDDAKVSSVEFHDSLERLGEDTTWKQDTKTVNKFDESGDGSLEIAEFDKLLDENVSTQDHELTVLETQHDGIITPAELEGNMAYFEKTLGAAPVKSPQEIVFDLMDSNSNGQLAEPEFQEGMKKLKADADWNAIDKTFKDFDASEDGNLDFNEFLKVMKSDISEKNKYLTVFETKKDGHIHTPELAEKLDYLRNTLVSWPAPPNPGPTKYEQWMSKTRSHINWYSMVGCSPRPQWHWPSGQVSVFDESCMWHAEGGLGCWAAGTNQRCRFCGFGVYPACPPQYDCMQNCNAWTQDMFNVCTGKWGIECPAFDLNWQDKEDLKNAMMKFDIENEERMRQDSFLNPSKVSLHTGLAVLGLLLGSFVLFVAYRWHSLGAQSQSRFLGLEENLESGETLLDRADLVE